MSYGEHATYEILQTKLMDFAALQRMRGFARFWDLIGNSGNFINTTPLIWSDAPSPFTEFMRLCDWLYERLGRKHGIPLAQLGDLIFQFLTEVKAMAPAKVPTPLWQDYQRAGRSPQPVFLLPHLP